MVIDEEFIKDGITGELISELIARHEIGNTRLNRLMDYYLGRHEILSRERSNDKIANNRIICNHAKYIVDMIKSYLVGNPVSYACSDIYDISAVKNCYIDQDIESLDSEIEKEMSIYGKFFSFQQYFLCFFRATVHIRCHFEKVIDIFIAFNINFFFCLDCVNQFKPFVLFFFQRIFVWCFVQSFFQLPQMFWRRYNIKEYAFFLQYSIELFYGQR